MAAVGKLYFISGLVVTTYEHLELGVRNLVYIALRYVSAPRQL
jgi:hypothetical protein